MAKKQKGLTLRDKAKWRLKQIKKQATKRELTPFEKKKRLEENAKKMAGKLTKPEREFDKLMKEMNIECESQKIIGGSIYDFYLPEYKMLIEIDGDYYHGNPAKYTKDQLNGMQKKNKLNDKEKDIQAKGFGYKIERVWEHDINKEYSSVRMRFTKLLLA
jgi:very-short-patch-repair endonuclease|tara:strand:- start:11738 stop:12217 length:480 start_codon:yes stop_codon:yes gene_type:complete